MFKGTGHTGKIDKIQKTLSEGNTGKTGNTALMESPKELCSEKEAINEKDHP